MLLLFLGQIRDLDPLEGSLCLPQAVIEGDEEPHGQGWASLTPLPTGSESEAEMRVR